MTSNWFRCYFIVTQTQSANEETTTQTSSTSAPVINKPNTSPVNTALNATTTTNVTQARQSPVQQQGNESVSTPSRNQMNSTGQPVWSSTLTEDQIYAKSPPEPHHPRGWLVDLINRYVLHLFNQLI